MKGLLIALVFIIPYTWGQETILISDKCNFRWWQKAVPVDDVDYLFYWEILVKENVADEWTVNAETEKRYTTVVDPDTNEEKVLEGTQYLNGLVGTIPISEALANLPYKNGWMAVRAVNSVGLKSERSTPAQFTYDETVPLPPDSIKVEIKIPAEVTLNVIREDTQ